MSNIDLRDFAHYTVKIPTSLLDREIETRPLSLFKVLAAHSLDFVIVLTSTIFISILLSDATLGLLPNAKLVSISKLQGQLPTSALFPVILFCYFFFMNFFNHGQSFGGHKLKLRIQMGEKDFTQSFKQAAMSFLLCMSGGLLISYYRKHLKFVQHDWLYLELMKEKDERNIDLFKLIPETNEQDEVAEESITFAA